MIKIWGGRNLRSRYAGRDWIVDKFKRSNKTTKKGNESNITASTNNNDINEVPAYNSDESVNTANIDETTYSKLKVAEMNAYQYTFSFNFRNNEIEIPVCLVNEKDRAGVGQYRWPSQDGANWRRHGPSRYQDWPESFETQKRQT